jgi:predicted RNA-binding protein YlqC (UPF0109 family)
VEQSGELQEAAGAAELRDFVEFVCQTLVEDPDGVQVDEVTEQGDRIFEVSVEGEDLGRLIGRGGKVANAIRTLVKAAARAQPDGHEGRVLVEFVED